MGHIRAVTLTSGRLQFSDPELSKGSKTTLFHPRFGELLEFEPGIRQIRIQQKPSLKNAVATRSLAPSLEGKLRNSKNRCYACYFLGGEVTGR